MTREEAIEIINCYDIGFCDLSGKKIPADKLVEAFDMAIEALKRERTDEWCTGCKEYDTEKKCCPRFNKVIREALKREPSDDGTLEVKVEDATKIGRVLIADDKHRGGLYYPDEDEPQGDLISREAVKAKAVKFFGHDVIFASHVDTVPSADRPRGEWIHTPNGIDRDFVWWVCSECGHKIFSETEKDRIEFHAYCGRCGAEMRSE